MNSHRNIFRIIFWVIVAAVAAWSLAPFAWQVVTSFKPKQEIIRIPPTYMPSELHVENYAEIFRSRPFATYIWNSILIACGATVLALLAGVPAAYALARMRIRHSQTFLRLILLGALFPAIVFLVPLHEIVRGLHLSNSKITLIVPYAAFNLPFVVWVLYSFFRQVPQDLEDAAMVDGFSRTGTLLKIMLPVSAPALATTAILVFIFSWNEFLFALTFMTADTARTVPVGIAMLRGASIYEIPWGQISAAIVLSTLPVVIVVLFLQRRIVQGLTAGAVKG